MASKLLVPRPGVAGKVKPEEKKPIAVAVIEETLDDAEVIADAEEEEVDHTEPSGPPIVIVMPSRPIAMSLPSPYELESERKSSPPVLERRKQLTTFVASAIGVAWFICLFAVGQSALRSVISSVGGDAKADVRTAHR